MVLSWGFAESYGTGPDTANQPGKLGMHHSLPWLGKQHQNAISNKQ